MPLDVTGGANFCDPATPAYKIRWLVLNDLKHTGTLFPTLGSSRPNPSSARGYAPGSNIVAPNRSRSWKSRGYFCISSETNKGYEMAPNWQVEFGVAGVTVDVRPAATPTTTHYTDPRAMTDYAQSVIRASAQTGASAYTVTYDDERQTPSGPTYKVTIASNGANFDLLGSDDPDSILPSWGFTAASYTGSNSYTGENVAIHTEEYLVVDRNETIRTTNATEITQDFRWLVLVDLNYTGAIPTSASAAGADKIVLYTSASGVTLDATPDSSFTEGTDMFTLLNDVNMGAVWGNDAEVNVHRSGGFTVPGIDMSPARMWVFDLRSWKGSAFDYNNDKLRIKIVNRTNPAGHISLGYMFLGPGFAFSSNPAYPYQSGASDQTELQLSEGGSFNSRFQEPGYSEGGSWSDNAPMSEIDHWWVKSVFLRGRKTDTTAPHQMVSDKNVIGGLNRPTILIDPNYSPGTLTVGGTFPNVSKYARGAMFGYMKFKQGAERFVNIRHGDFEFIEEPID